MNNSTNKTCAFCKQEVKEGAVKCPHCQSDLRSWYAKHPVFIAIVLLITLPVFLSVFTAGVRNAISPSVADSTANTRPESNQPVVPLIARLNKLEESKVFEKPYAFTEEMTCNDLYNAMNISPADINIVVEGLNSASTTEKGLAQRLKTKANARDIKEKPKARKMCADRLKNMLWDNDIEVSVSGEGNRTLTLVGAIFASNKGIGTMHEASVEMYKKLGYKTINYKWYRNASEYTYFNLKDSNEDMLSFK